MHGNQEGGRGFVSHSDQLSIWKRNTLAQNEYIYIYIYIHIYTYIYTYIHDANATTKCHNFILRLVFELVKVYKLTPLKNLSNLVELSIAILVDTLDMINHNNS